MNQVKRASHFVKIIVGPVPIICPNCQNQLNVNRQYPIRADCSIVTVTATMFRPLIHYSYRMAGIRSGLDRRECEDDEEAAAAKNASAQENIPFAI
jgi:hypothetical protein